MRHEEADVVGSMASLAAEGLTRVTGRLARRVTAGAGAAAVLLVLAACADPAAAGPDGDDVGGLAGFPPCEGLPTITADSSLYRDEPRYGNAMELVDGVRAWASARPGFEDLWLDRDHHGWVHAGFHGPEVDVDVLQREVAQAFPGEGVVVVRVPYTLAELEDLSDRVHAALRAVGGEPTGGSALSVPRGVVSLLGVVDSPEVRGALRGFAGEPLCVDAVPADAFVPEGPQPAGGDGWRLLGHEQGAGEAYRTGVATTDAQLTALWREAELPHPVPAVDWRSEIVVWFGAVWGSSCPVRLDGVVVDGATLHAQIVVPGAGPVTACTADARPHSYVVAVDRSHLPQGGFVVQLGPTDPPAGAPHERTVVDVDLSAPGARATDAQLHADPGTGPAPVPLVEDGHPGMPPNGGRYVWHPRPECRGVVVGPFDGTLWRLADGEAPWAEDAGQEVVLHPVDDDSIVVSSPGMDYAFVRAAEGTCP